MVLNLILISCVCVIFNIILIKISKKFNLLDYPSERKIHKNATPYTGGISIALSYVFISYFIKENIFFIDQIIIYSSMIAFLALLDDKFEVKPIFKIILQLIVISLLIYNVGYLKDLGNYDFIGLIYFGNFGIIITTLACLLLINAFNYSDGLDGLLSSIYVIIILNFIIILHIVDVDNSIIKYYTFLIIPVLIFLIFNFGFFKSNKLFLGDSGSNFLGLFTAFTAISLYLNLNIHPSLIMWPLAYIVFEFLSTNLSRMIKRTKILEPGFDHLHYDLINFFKFSKIKVVIIILFLNVSLNVFGYTIFFKQGPFFSIIGFIITFFIYVIVKNLLFFKKKFK